MGSPLKSKVMVNVKEDLLWVKVIDAQNAEKSGAVQPETAA
jgi:hypothetical protein